MMNNNPTPPSVITRNSLSMRCLWNEDGRLGAKLESLPGQVAAYEYAFDGTGHLTGVSRNKRQVERYTYNDSGQRTETTREGVLFDRTSGRLVYDRAGKLIRAGESSYSYDKRGALAKKTDSRGSTRYFYGGDTMPDRIVLPDKTEIRYQYDASNPIGPARRYRNGTLTMEYHWLDPVRLMACRDHDHGLDYLFAYDDNGLLDMIRLEPFRSKQPQPSLYRDNVVKQSGDWKGRYLAFGRRQRLREFFEEHGLPLDLSCGTDQVGTLVSLSDEGGVPIKVVQRDSFGVRLSDSLPDLPVPIGFAGGLEDLATGLVRFGYRDYDPEVGRFTAPDPLGDTGGDHDLYDYCIDDPVTMSDPLGLIAPLLLLLGGKALAMGIAGAGAYGSAWVADKIKGLREGKQSTAARDAIKTVAPEVRDIAISSIVPAVAPAAVLPAMQAGTTISGAYTAMGQRIGAAMEAGGMTGIGLRVAKEAAELTQGFVVPGPPSMKSFSEGIGAGASHIYKKYRELF